MVCLLLFSCGNTTERSVQAAIDNFMDKKLECVEYILNDSVKKILNSSNYKIIAYIDGTCSACIEDLKLWSSLQKDSILNANNVKIIYFVRAYDVDQLKTRQRIFKISNVVMDRKNEFFELNSLKDYDKKYHIFLLDSSNIVRAIGSPIKSSGVLQLYRKIIERK